MVKKPQSKTKVFIFDPSKPLSILRFRTSFELARGTNLIQEGTDLWVAQRFVLNYIVVFPNCCSIKGKGTLEAVTIINFSALTSQCHCFRPYLEAMNYLLKHCTNNQTNV